MKDVSWRQVVVIAVVMAGIVVVTLSGRDTTALVAIGGGILAALGFVVSQGQTVKEQTNGRIGELIKLIESQGRMLAGMIPPTLPPPTPAEGTVVNAPADTLDTPIQPAPQQ